MKFLTFFTIPLFSFLLVLAGCMRQDESVNPLESRESALIAQAVVAVTALPGRLQAEDYQAGGELVGYHDLTSGNSGNQYRTDNVDIAAVTDIGGGFNVGWIQAGEWLDYDVTVATAGAYNLTARVASAVAGTKTATLSVDGLLAA